MGQAGDSITVTPGAGATVATETWNSKEHQLVGLVGEGGHRATTALTYIYSSTGLTNVAAARTTHYDLFNATGSGVIVRVWGIYIIPALVAVTGVGLTWEIAKSTTVGSGGNTVTGVALDSTNAGINANVTCRNKPTGGASIGSVMFYVNSSSEETNPYAGLASQLNHVPYIGGQVQPIILREDQGLKIDQTTNSAVGTTTITLVTTQHAL